MTRHPIRRAIAGLYLLLLLLLVGGVLAAFLDRAPVVSVTSGEAVTQRVRPGEVLEIRWEDFQLHRYCPGEVHRIIRGCGYHVIDHRLATGGVSAPRELITRVKIPTTVPAYAQCEFVALAEYWCNPAQRLMPLRQHLPPVYFVTIGR